MNPAIYADHRDAIRWLQRNTKAGRLRTVFLVEWNRNQNMCSCIRELRKCREHAYPVLLSHDPIQGDAVLDAVRAGAGDIFGAESETFALEQLRKAANGMPAYAPFSNLKLPRKTKKAAFAIIPYVDEVLNVWQGAITPALDRLGVTLEMAKDNPTSLQLNHKIREMIINADIVMADISMSKPLCGRIPSGRCYGLHNANVYYEIGFAHGIGKPVLLLRSASCPGPAPVVPTDIQGIEWQSYHDMTHAALMIYNGLKP